MNLSIFDSEWRSAIARLLLEVHAVDRDALLIWLQLYPLKVARLAAADANRAEFERYYQMRGRYLLAESADTSHQFLYSHRYWPAVRAALGGMPEGLDLLGLIRHAASGEKMALPIAAVGLMTLRQAGPAFLTSGYQPPLEGRTPEQILAARGSDQPQSVWGKLLGAKAALRITMAEDKPDRWFPIMTGQHVTTGAELDKRTYHESDERCYKDMGPIPVDCRAGSCGTCWVGILGGRENTEPVTEFERKRMNYFGYWENEFHEAGAERPLIRLACQTIVRGSASIVIPPWNGVLGESRQKRREEG